uniref:Ig-like domain-containing protein n=1 Tax=Scylla olivacea TaxID=85551 RepID=A0A0P4VVG1_SCYOL
MRCIVYTETLVLLLLLLNAGSECVVVQQVGTRGPAVAGRAVQLECLWSQGSGPPLYVVQWCKDGDMFFRVTLVPEPRKVVFPTPGVQVVVGASSEHRVTLTNVTAATAGNYSCEAMSDTPDFFVSALSVYIPVLEGEWLAPLEPSSTAASRACVELFLISVYSSQFTEHSEVIS